MYTDISTHHFWICHDATDFGHLTFELIGQCDSVKVYLLYFTEERHNFCYNSSRVYFSLYIYIVSCLCLNTCLHKLHLEIFSLENHMLLLDLKFLPVDARIMLES